MKLSERMFMYVDTHALERGEMFLFGHGVRRVLGAGDGVSVVDLAGRDQVTQVVRSDVECFAALRVLEVVMDSHGWWRGAPRRDPG